MKLLIACLLAIASFTVLVDSISIKNDDFAYLDDEELERGMPLDEQEFEVDDPKKQMESKEDLRCTNGTVNITICEPITASKITKVLEQIGATIDPAVRIANASKSFLAKLKSNNGTLTATQKKKRSSNNIGMCQESSVVESFHIIHPYVSLMYIVSGATCVNNYCFAPNCSPNSPIGYCILTKRTMVLHLFNEDGLLFPRTIEVGAACKCKSF